MIKALIFDLDGTLLDTIHAITYTVNSTMHELGLGEVDEAHVKCFVGEGFQALIDRALHFLGDTSLAHKEEGYRIYQRIFSMECMRDVTPYDGIIDVLSELKKRGIMMAVLSNKPQERTQDNIYMAFGKDCFTRVYGEREGIQLKPDPTGVEMLIEELGLEKEECLFVGDTKTDLLTGMHAGIKTIGVTWGFRERKELEAYHPTYIIEHPSEIIKIVH